MEKNKLITKVFIIGAGMAFLASSVAGLSGLIATSLNGTPANEEKTTQSQSAQFQAEEKGFLAVLQREPKNQTALRGLVQIRMQRGDIPGTQAALEQIVKAYPDNKEYKAVLDAVNKQIADTKKVGTLKSTEPTQPTKPSK
jgi:thioredoxin-like negative regulator of GroEL